MIMREASERYPENPIELPIVHLETLDGHGTSRVLSVAHVREPSMVVDLPNPYELLLNNV